MDDELNEFVVCPSCGTRIKAGREFCLRCFGPLPTAERPIKPPVWVSLGLSDTKKQVVAGVVAAAVISLGAVIYVTEPQEVDDTARPYSASPTPRNAPDAAPKGGRPRRSGRNDCRHRRRRNLSAAPARHGRRDDGNRRCLARGEAQDARGRAREIAGRCGAAERRRGGGARSARPRCRRGAAIRAGHRARAGIRRGCT